MLRPVASVVRLRKWPDLTMPGSNSLQFLKLEHYC